MSTPKKPTLRFPGKPQIRLRAEIDVISGLLIRAYHLLIRRLLMPLITPVLNRPGLISVVCEVSGKERHLTGLPVRFSIFRFFTRFLFLEPTR